MQLRNAAEQNARVYTLLMAWPPRWYHFSPVLGVGTLTHSALREGRVDGLLAAKAASFF